MIISAEIKPVNYIFDNYGLVAAVCECCGNQTEFLQPDKNGEPPFWKISGWSQAPYPKNFIHKDGSIGSIYHCPSCEKRLRAGETLRMRSYIRSKAP